MRNDVLIRNGLVVTMDPELGDVSGGSVLIRDGRIAEVGRDLEAAQGCEVVDADGMVVIPGFVDTHKHLWQTPIRSAVADLTLIDYFTTVRRDYLSRFRAQDVGIGTYVGALELIDGGTTTVLDHSHGVVTPEHGDALAEAIKASGIRGVWAYGYAGVEPDDGGPTFGSHDDRVADAHRVREQYFSDGGLIRMGVAVTEQGALPFELTEREVRSARDMDVVWTAHTHCPPGNAPITRGFHQLQALGLVDHRAVLSHCNEFGPDDFALVAAAGAHYVSSPESEISFGIPRPAPYAAALAAGVQPCLGTDCVTCMTSDMFACMRSALLFARHQLNAGPAQRYEVLTQQQITTRDVFRWATIEGAKALGLAAEVGSLSPGKAADLVLIDATAINLSPMLDDPVATLVLHGHAGNVDTVLIDGVVRKRHGRLVDVDLTGSLDRLAHSRDFLIGSPGVAEATS